MYSLLLLLALCPALNDALHFSMGFSGYASRRWGSYYGYRPYGNYGYRPVRRLLEEASEPQITFTEVEGVACDTFCLSTEHGMEVHIYADGAQVSCEKHICSGTFPDQTLKDCCTPPVSD